MLDQLYGTCQCKEKLLKCYNHVDIFDILPLKLEESMTVLQEKPALQFHRLASPVEEVYV